MTVNGWVYGWDEAEEWDRVSITFSMHVDDVSGNGFIGDGIALVENHEEQIKPTHDGGGDVDVGLEGFAAVISPEHRVRGCK